ncbi:MAG: hypothetical protein JNK48_29250 [Bryobacterales bacterium]|nr:hypothetical protein [Bryobacterales bacterium]
MNEHDMRNLFRDMRDEPLPADSLARVRMGVEEKIARGSRRPFSLRWPVLVAGLAAVFLLAVLVTRPGSVDTVPPAVIAKKEPAAPAPPAPRRMPVEVKPAPRRGPDQVKARPSAPKQEPLMRLETPDPNVVIFLVAEGAGE